MVPWGVPVQMVELYSLRAKTGGPAFAIETMLRIHYPQQWFALSDPAIERRCTTCRCFGNLPS